MDEKKKCEKKGFRGAKKVVELPVGGVTLAHRERRSQTAGEGRRISVNLPALKRRSERPKKKKKKKKNKKKKEKGGGERKKSVVPSRKKRKSHGISRKKGEDKIKGDINEGTRKRLKRAFKDSWRKRKKKVLLR